MVKGVSAKFTSYEETLGKLLRVIKFDNVLRDEERVVLKPNLMNGVGGGTSVEFVEPILKFCMQHKNPGTEIFIAEGCDGQDTMEVFDEMGYKDLAEKYGVGLIDLNRTETEEKLSENFLTFDKIHYPRILLDSFVISLPVMREDPDVVLAGALSNMVGAFPAMHYKGFFSKRKNKLDAYPMKYQVHDIVVCKHPEFAIVDGSDNEVILAGQPLEIDKKAAEALGIGVQGVGYLRLIEESLYNSQSK